MKKDSEMIVVETPEHFELEFKLAGIGTRSLAFIIDRCIQWGLVLILVFSSMIAFYLLGDLANLGSWMNELIKFLGQWVIAVLILVYGIVMIGYFILFEYLWSGSTPGKRSVDIRVIRKDGRPVTLVDSAVRNILRFIDLFAELYPFGLAVMFIDGKNRRLGDMAAGTYVVFDRRARRPDSGRTVNDLASEDRELRDAVTGMSPDDYRLVSKFLSRRNDMELDYRADLARELHERIFQKTLPANIPLSAVERALLDAAAQYREKTRVL